MHIILATLTVLEIMLKMMASARVLEVGRKKQSGSKISREAQNEPFYALWCAQITFLQQKLLIFAAI